MSPYRKSRAVPVRGSSLALLLLACWATAGQAYTVSDLYVAQVPVTQRAGTPDAAAFSAAMAIVLVKVTGIEAAPSQLRSAVANARSYVQRYGFDASGQLEVGFDSVALDRLIREAGLPVWGRERPATLVIARVASPATEPVWLAADSAEPARELIDDAADRRGVPLVWPLFDVQEQATVRAFDRRSPRPEELASLAERYRADAVLFADLEADPDGRLTGNWTFGFGEEVANTTGAPEAGMALAVEQFINVYAASAGALTLLDVEVTGIADLVAYARTLEYLEDLSVTEQVSVDELAGDVLRVRLALRGDASTFERSVALDDRLVPVEQPGQTGRLLYRYQP